MIRKIYYGLFIIAAMMIISCGDQTPVELLLEENSAEDDNLEFEVLSPEPDQYEYSNGYDTTGIVPPVPSLSSIISVSQVKNTRAGQTSRVDVGLAVFFDKNRPVLNSSGRIVGYKTRAIGTVLFNNEPADLVDYRLSYPDHGVIVDTLLGKRHLLIKHPAGSSQSGYGQNVNFKLRILGNVVKDFNIPSPKEITGQIRRHGIPMHEDFSLELKWNRSDDRKIEIIISGRNEGSSKIVPLFRVYTRDDGKLILPKWLISNIPFHQFEYVIFSFIRRHETIVQSDNNISDHLITSQNIHNIEFSTN